MRLNVDLELQLSPRQKKVVRAAVVAGAVIGALGLGIAIAAPHQWKTSDTLTATDLNGLNVASVDGGVYSVGATLYCGTTTTVFNGNIGGRPATRQQCQTTCGTSTAHMCTLDELERSRSLGMTLTYAATGATTHGLWVAGVATTTVSGDCNGWTSSAGGGATTGAAWGYFTNASPDQDGPTTGRFCSDVYPIACCD